MIKLAKYFNGNGARQVVLLMLATLSAVPLNLFSNVMMARILGPESFGDLRLLISILTISCTIFTFGFYQSAARLIVKSSSGLAVSRYYGSALLATGLLHFLMSAFIFLFFYFDENINSKGLFGYVYVLLILGWVFLLKRYFETILHSSNNIGLLALSRVFQPFVLLLVLTIYFFGLVDVYDLSKVKVVLVLYLLSFVLCFALVLYKLEISFKYPVANFSKLLIVTKKFGFNVYVGGVFPIVIASFSEVLISYSGGSNVGVGFYALAVSLCSFISIMPNVIASVSYKNFASQKKVPFRIFASALMFGFAAQLLLILIIKPFVLFFYGTDFKTVITLCYILSSGVLFHGMGDLLNRYLGSNGFGKYLRNSALIVGLVLLILNLILIPMYGEYGAAFAGCISGFIYFIVTAAFYKSAVRSAV